VKVLGIETSCDETGVAVYDTARGLLSHKLHSQVDIHANYGGVVPEIASRDHVRKWVKLTEDCVAEAGIKLTDLDAVAYTAGPGLAGALFTGAVAGRALAWQLGIKALGVHHMEGHLLAPMLETPSPSFPFLCLLVSGGHSQLVKVASVGDYELLGDTLDDAVGEAFDKTAKMLGLGYPGGPALAKAAESGDAGKFTFPRPMARSADLNFSFSGLKTAAITAFEKTGRDAAAVNDIAAAFEMAAVESLAIKCKKALLQENMKTLVCAGGVAANTKLRALLEETIQTIDGELYFPRLEFCTDNGAMIAYAGAYRLLAGESTGAEITVKNQIDPGMIDQNALSYRVCSSRGSAAQLLCLFIGPDFRFYAFKNSFDIAFVPDKNQHRNHRTAGGECG